MKNHYLKLLLLNLFLFPLFLNAQPPLTSFSWSQLSTGTGGPTPCTRVLLTKYYGSNLMLYAGGDFILAGSAPANYIAAWNGSAWSPIGKGTNNEVTALSFFNNKLYAGGKFDSAGGIAASHIACWDSTNGWDSLNGSLNGNVYALCAFNNALYMGGDFTTANGLKVNRIAKWDGTKWDSVGAGFDSNTVFALTTFNDTLYAGGSFTKSNGKTVNYIAKWNGTKWQNVGSGMNNAVYALCAAATGAFTPNDTALYAGGAFTTAGGINANHITALHSGLWDSVSSGTNDTVRALGVGYSTLGVIIKRKSALSIGEYFLLVGGNFTKAGGLPDENIAFWDGTTWDTIGYVNGPVYAVSGGSLNYFTATNYIGGLFDSAFAPTYQPPLDQVNNVAALDLLLGGSINELYSNSTVAAYPNPNNGNFTLLLKDEKLKGTNRVEIYNELGERVYMSSFGDAQSVEEIIDLNGKPAGIYLCRVLDEEGMLIGSTKLIIQ